MDVVAEGVETEGQRARLTAMDCEFGQGYHFSKPMDSDAAEAFLLSQIPLSGLKPQAASHAIAHGAFSPLPTLPTRQP
jgi:predicted signal transduction protein with EAL and GGDEF domain